MNGQEIMVLIDSDSPHNFVKTSSTSFMTVLMEMATRFYVYVGNGDVLVCSRIHKEVPLLFQLITFMVDLHVFQIKSPDIVLRMQWLQLATLGNRD